MTHEAHDCACCQAQLGELFGFDPASTLAADIQILPVAKRNSGAVTNSLRRVIGGSYAADYQLIAPETDQTVTVYVGGTVMTVDASFSKAEAISIKGQNILAVGDRESVEAAAGPEANIIDLEGCTIMPGFIDPHTHIVIGALMDQAMEYVGITRFRTTAEVLGHIQSLDETRDDKEWIVCRNYYPMLQPFDRPLGFETLDAISSTRPILVLNASGHIAYANHAAFEAANVDETIKDPPGGAFVRDESGQLTGEMRNQVAFSKVMSARPGGAGAAPAEAIVQTTARFASLGLTTVTELALGGLLRGASDWEILKQAGATGRLSQRIRAYPLYAFDEAWDEANVQPGDGDEMVRLAGFKMIADGSNQGFTGLQRKAYHTVDSRGMAYMEPEALTAMLRKRARKGWPIAIHGNGDAAIDNILSSVEILASEGIDVAALRIRIEHCSILHDEQIEKMKEFGISASFLIGHVHYWGAAMRDKIFGPVKSKLLDRCASLESAGVGYTIHSDFFVTDPNPLHMIEMAATRESWAEPGWALAPEECASREGAIRAMTSEAAWQIGSEHEIGSLEEGKRADFVILDKDPSVVPANKIKDVVVLETWMNGQQTYAAQVS